MIPPMENTTAESILALAEKSERIAILLGDSSRQSDFLAAQALRERLGSKAVLVNAPDDLQRRWDRMFERDDARKEFAISLDINQNPVEELRYEKDGGKLRIFLTPQKPITKESFELEERYTASDMIIALGFPSKAALNTKLEEVTLKNPDALVDLSEPIGPINNSVPVREAEPQANWHPDTMKLWARSVLRSYSEDDIGVYWAFLPKEDFVKTGQSSAILPTLLSDMRRFVRLPDVAVILWQEPTEGSEQVRALIHTDKPDKLKKIATEAHASPNGSHVLVYPYPNFSEAELEIRKLLKKVL